MQGRKVNAEILENTNSKKVLNVNNLEKGVYNVQIVIKEDNEVINKRFTVN